MIYQIITKLSIQHSFRQRHTNGIGDPLPQRPSRGFNPSRMTIFRMTRRFSTQLPEVFNFIDGDIFISHQEHQRIK